MCFKLIEHEQWKKEKHWKQPANELEPCTGALYERFWKMKKMGMLAQITLFNVGFHMGGMNQWNGSRKQDKRKSTLASRRQAAESDMASPEEQNDRWCVTGAHWLIDTWHLKAKSMASHARQITGYHRKTQKNTEICDFRILRANSSFFTSICLFEIKKDLNRFKMHFCALGCVICGCFGRTFGT